MKKTILLFLTALMVFLFSACVRNGEDETQRLYGTDLQGNGGSILYEVHEIEMPDLDSYYSFATAQGENVYIYGFDGEKNVLYLFDTTSEEITKVDCSLDGQVFSICTSPSGNICTLTYENVDESQNLLYKINKYDKSGSLICSTDISDAIDTDSIVTDFLVTEQGILITLINSNALLLDEDGGVIRRIENTQFASGIVSNSEGNIFLHGDAPNGYTVEIFDSNLNFIGKYTYDALYTGAVSGASPGMVLLTDKNNLYNVEYKSGNRTAIINFIANPVDTQNLIPISENRFFTFKSGKPVILEESDKTSSEEAGPVVLKLATYNMSYELSTAVIRFNSESKNTIIDVIDYAAYDTGDSLGNGLGMLNTEIISGNLPDLFDLSCLPGSVYADKGILKDLRPLIDSDKEISYDDFINSIMEAIEQDGYIYEFIPGFRIDAITGSPEYIDKDWDAATFLAAAEKAKSEGKSILPQYITREQFIKLLLSLSGKDFFNMDAGKCAFDSEIFAGMLKYASNLPAEAAMDNITLATLQSEEFERVDSGNQLSMFYLSGMPVGGILLSEGLFGKDVVSTGFPSAEGTGVGISPYIRLGVSSRCQNSERAWEFLKFMLDDEYQEEISKYQSLPVLKASLEKSIEWERQLYGEHGYVLAYYTDGGQEHTVDCGFPNDRTIEKLWNLIDRIDCITEYDNTIYEIVYSEAQIYFAGQQSIENTVSQIQSRVELYLNEQGS